MLARHYNCMSMQLIDSALPETRQFWRRKLGFKEWVIVDPRSISEILESLKES